MSTHTTGAPKRISVSGLIGTSSGQTLGVLCNVGGTFSLYDNFSATGTPFAAAILMAGGSYLPLPAAWANACWCEISGGGDFTFFVN